MTKGTTLSNNEKIIAREQVFSGKILRLVVDQVKLPDGSTSTREIVLHPGMVAILPILSDGRVLLVRQYRHAVGKSLWEIPAGKLDVTGESPQDCAIRELREETGYAASEWKELFTFYTSPGFTDERGVLFVARGLARVSEPLPDEIDLQRAFFPAEIIDLVSRGEIQDGKTILGVAWLWAHPR